MSTPLEQLEQALAQTRQMMAAAEEEDWDNLSQLHARREPLIREALKDPRSLGDRERQLGAELLRLNRRVEAISAQALSAQGEATRQIVRGRRAVKAYTRHET